MMKSDNNVYPVIDMKATGRNIRRIMKLTGLRVDDVKEFLGLASSQSIYHWFDGRSIPTVDHLYALSELFSVPIDYIIIGNRSYGITERGCRFKDRIQMYYILCYEQKSG